MTRSDPQYGLPGTSETLANPDDFITEQELARRTRVSVSTWQKRRATGDTPPYFKVGKHCRYQWSGVLQWFDEHKVRSTADATVRDNMSPKLKARNRRK